MMNKFLIALLAAGESKRLGTPKQIIRLNNEFLINLILKEINRISSFDSLIILGANFDEIKSKITSNQNLIYNKKFENGISESIKLAFNYSKDNYKGILFLSVDQYLVNFEILKKFENTILQYDENIIAASYNQEFGIPAYIPISYFDEVNLLEGDSGCKKIIKKFIDKTIFIPFNDGIYDIDIINDLILAEKKINNLL